MTTSLFDPIQLGAIHAPNRILMAPLTRGRSEGVHVPISALKADYYAQRASAGLIIAEATGIHRATLSKMANQPGANIGTDIIDKLCRYFGCQPGELLMFVDEDV